MMTSNFTVSGKHRRAVAISNGTPDFYKGPKYKPLIPAWQLVKDAKAGAVTQPEFEIEYGRQLARLDARRCYAELQNLVGGEPILLCWEGKGKPCHRHQVALWFSTKGIDVPELKNQEELLFTESAPTFADCEFHEKPRRHMIEHLQKYSHFVCCDDCRELAKHLYREGV